MVRLRLSTLLLAAAFGSMVGCSSTSRFNLFHRNCTTTEVCPETCGGPVCEGSCGGDHMSLDAGSTMTDARTIVPPGNDAATGYNASTGHGAADGAHADDHNAYAQRSADGAPAIALAARPPQADAVHAAVAPGGRSSRRKADA